MTPLGYLLLKAGLSGIIIAVVSELARRAPNIGALIASLPLISVLGIIWLWRDTGDTARISQHAYATFWFVLPSLPMFLLIPFLLGRGWAFWPVIGLSCIATMMLYLIMVWLLGEFGVRL